MLLYIGAEHKHLFSFLIYFFLFTSHIWIERTPSGGVKFMHDLHELEKLLFCDT